MDGLINRIDCIKNGDSENAIRMQETMGGIEGKLRNNK